MKIAKYALTACSVLALSACAGNPSQFITVKGPAVTSNPSQVDRAFECTNYLLSRQYTRPRIAVGQIKDYTGKYSNESSGGGFKLTQGGSQMVISALGKINNVDQVERFDPQIAEMEMGLAKQQLIADGKTTRPLIAGQVNGSDYYIVGGITEVNYDIQSGGAELYINQTGAGGRYYVMNIAADLRIVETKSLRVVKTISLQKQVVGHETEAGIFSFFGANLVDLNAGSKEQEPIQLGVRAVLEAATMQLVAAIYNVPFDHCTPYVEQRFSETVPPKKKGA